MYYILLYIQYVFGLWAKKAALLALKSVVGVAGQAEMGVVNCGSPTR